MANFFKGSPSSSKSSGKVLQGDLVTDLTNVQNPANQSKGIAAFTQNPAQYSQIGSSLAQFSDPNYLNVASDPNTQNLISSLTNASNTNLNQQLAGLKSQFAAQGQTGAGANSPLAQVEGQTIGNTQTSLNDTIAQQLFTELQSQKQNQLQGLSEESTNQLTPANLIAMLGGLTAKSKGAIGSALDSDAQGVGAGIGALAGIAGAFA